MFAANTYVIRQATERDEAVLRRLGQHALVGELDGQPAAAVSLTDGRTIADPFRPTARLLASLRVRAGAMRAAERTPSLRKRLRAGVRVATA